MRADVFAVVPSSRWDSPFSLPAPPPASLGRLCTPVSFVRDVIKEVAGFSPYEKRCLELLKVGKEKRCLKLLKHKLGSHKRGKIKRENLQSELRKQRMKQ